MFSVSGPRNFLRISPKGRRASARLVFRRAGHLDFPVAEEVITINIDFHRFDFLPDDPVAGNRRMILAKDVLRNAAESARFRFLK